MIPKEILSRSIVPLNPYDISSRALAIMEEIKVSHLPIVNNGEYVGLISENDIFDLNTPDEIVDNHHLSINRPYITLDKHIFDAVKLASEHQLTVIPVLDEKNKYVGVITLPALVGCIANISAFSNPGGIIVLEMGIHDYSLSEIAQIIESNEAKVLSLFINTSNDTMKMEVTIKVNKTDIGAILQTFHRYDYIVTASFDEADYSEDFRDRLESFYNYMNI